MKTDKKTVGFGGGITNARTVRPKRCAAPVVQMRRCENARMPRWKRWGLYALAALTMSGIIPALACNALLWLCESVGWWLLVPLYVVVGRALWRVMWS